MTALDREPRGATGLFGRLLPNGIGGGRLFGRLAGSLALQLAVVSVLFLIAFVVLYRASLVSERTQAAEKIGLLLQVSLENAMLKRDIEGLRDIVERLGQQPDIASVMILDPKGEVRFSSRPERLGKRFDIGGGGLCPTCTTFDSMAGTGSVFLADDSAEVLRSIKAVPNREPCTVCHGTVASHPVNGILVVDHSAGGIRRQAAVTAAILAGSGAVVMLLLALGTWVTLRRFVLKPVEALSRTSRSLAGGNLEARSDLVGDDELAELGSTLDTMAGRLSESLGRVRQREDFLQAALDGMTDGIRVIDADYRVVRANRAFLAQTGLPADAVIGKPCWSSSHRRDEPCVPTLVSCPVAELKSSGQHMKFSDRHRRGDDEEMVVEVAAATMNVVDEKGSHLMVVEAIRDLEEMAKISHEQKLSEIGQLATGVAHEIRNPLASIRLALQAATHGIESGDCEDAKVSLRLVDQEIERCLGITGSLLKLSMPATGALDLVVLDELVAEVMSLLAWEAETARITVRLDLDPGLRVICSDSELRMVVTNLAQNAYHAMPDGGMLEISVKRENGEIVLSVSDEGVGIRPEDLESIFLPFWSLRADGVRGTGLGLAICRAIVKRAGGTITVVSTLGRGTRFTVRMPDADHDQIA